MANIELDGANKKIKVDSGDLTLDVPGDIVLDADGADLVFADGGTNILKVTNSSSDVVFQPQVDAKDLKFNQYDGRTLLEVNDGGFVAIANGATGPGQLRLYEDTDNGTNYTAFQVGTQSGDVTYTLPTADGSNGNALLTNGSGTLSWGSAGAATLNALTDVSMDITNFPDGILIQPNSDGSAPTTGTLSSATQNVGIGKNVFAALTSGSQNIAFGPQSGQALTTGGKNILIGDTSGAAITTGSHNIIMGGDAGDAFDTESNNIGIGKSALGGSIAGAEYCIALGHEAGQVITSGDNNTLVGYQAGEAITSGENNVCVGNYAGNVLVGGSNNICIGYEADTSANDISHGITLGYNMTSSSNVFAFGKSGDVVSNTFSSNANWSRSSDIRKKREIYDQGLGLDFINDLRTVNFQWKPQNEFPKEWNDYSETSSNDTEVVMHGFIAQEVKEALDKHASKRDSVFAGWSEGEDGMQHTSREMFVIPLIKAVQELSAEVKELKAKLEDK